MTQYFNLILLLLSFSIFTSLHQQAKGSAYDGRQNHDGVDDPLFLIGIDPHKTFVGAGPDGTIPIEFRVCEVHSMNIVMINRRSKNLVIDEHNEHASGRYFR